MPITLLELWLAVVGLVAFGGALRGVVWAHRAEWEREAEGLNGALKRRSQKNVVRQWMRAVAALSIFAAGMHVLLRDNQWDDVTAPVKVALAICGTALSVTVLLDEQR